jgi:tetratricopeptide (TPR) repeat protein
MKTTNNTSIKAAVKTAMLKDNPGEAITPGKADKTGFDMQELRNILQELKQREYALFKLAKSFVDQAAKQDLSRRSIAMELLEQDKGAEANDLLAHEELDRRRDVLSRREARTGKDVSKARQELLDEYLLKTKTAAADFRLRVREQRRQAGEAYAKAIELQRLLKSPLNELAGTLFEYAHLLYDSAKYGESEPRYSESLAIYRQLADDDPEKFRPEIAKTLSYLGSLHYATQEFEQAEIEFTESLEIRRDMATANPLKYRKDLAYALNDMGSMQSKLGNLDLSEECHTEALEIFRKLSLRNSDLFRPERAMTLYSVGFLHQTAGKYQYAQSEYLESIAIFRTLTEIIPELRDNLAVALCNLGVVHDNLKQIQQAEAEYIEAIAMRRELAKYDFTMRPELARAIACLANLHDHNQQREKAEVEYLEVLEIWRNEALMNPEWRRRAAQTLTCLGGLQMNLKKYEEMEKNLREATAILREMAAAGHEECKYDLTWALNRRGLMYCDLERYKEARIDFEECIDLHRKLKVEARTSNSDMELCSALCAYGVMLLTTKKMRKGRQALKEAREIAVANSSHSLSKGYVEHIDEVLNPKKK